MSLRPIRFFHRGAVVEVDSAAPTRTVLDWLREDAHCTGTKEGCNEGDCGACTVVVAELAPAGATSDDVVAGVRLRSANACLQFLPTLDGKALFTVEDLTSADGVLHPVQQAMVDCHGSQCGFCTPGFVMSLWATYQHHTARGTPDAQAARRRALRAIFAAAPATGRSSMPASGCSTCRRPGSFASVLVGALAQLRQAPPLRLKSMGGAEFSAPTSLAEFAAERLAHPEARILAGSTDIGLWVNKMFRELPHLVYIGNVAELKRIDASDSLLTIGAAASLEDGWRALGGWP
jgi:xanthine dehydrogenase small subunit